MKVMILLYAACSPIARIVTILTFSLAKPFSHVKLYVVLQHNGNAYLMQIPSADKCGRGVDQVLKVCIDRCVLQELCIVLYVDRGAGEELIPCFIRAPSPVSTHFKLSLMSRILCFFCFNFLSAPLLLL